MLATRPGRTPAQLLVTQAAFLQNSTHACRSRRSVLEPGPRPSHVFPMAVELVRSSPQNGPLSADTMCSCCWQSTNFGPMPIDVGAGLDQLRGRRGELAGPVCANFGQPGHSANMGAEAIWTIIPFPGAASIVEADFRGPEPIGWIGLAPRTSASPANTSTGKGKYRQNPSTQRPCSADNPIYRNLDRSRVPPSIGILSVCAAFYPPPRGHEAQRVSSMRAGTCARK